MAKNTLMVVTSDQKEFRQQFDEHALLDLEVIVPMTPEEILANIERPNILFANPPMTKEYINDAKNVKWVQSTFAGVDSLNSDDLRKDYILTNVRDVYGEAMAEYAFAYILAFEKEIFENRTFQEQKVWGQRMLHTLDERTLAVLGTGSIGKCIGKIGKSFSMRTVGFRSVQEPVEYFDEIYAGQEGLFECLSTADYVVSVLPNTKHTTGLIGAEALSHMKRGSCFINIGRGNALNEKALVALLKSGKIARAVLDVFNKEPLPSDDALWTTQNLYITPHMAGYIAVDKLFDIFAENYRRFRAGEDLKYRVDFTKGY